MFGSLFQQRRNLWTCIQTRHKTFACARAHISSSNIHARAVQIIGTAFYVHLTTRRAQIFAIIRLHQPCRHKIMLNHADITAIGFALVFGSVFARLEIIVQIVKCHFLKLAFGRVQRRTRVAVHKPALPFRRTVVAHHTVRRCQFHRFAAAVAHIKAHIHQIAVFMERINLVNAQTFGFGRS